jgi:hypothetical protein
MSTKSILSSFTISTTLALIIIITLVGILVTSQPALAKLSSSTGNNQYQEVITTTSQKGEISSERMLVGYEEKERYDIDAEDIDDDSDKASTTKYEEEGDKQCRKGNVLKGVYNPGRLNVLSSCEEVIGIVDNSERVNDGDYKLYLGVEDQYKNLLNEANDERVNGLLVVEIIPKDQDSIMIEIPKDGDRVRVVGAWVSDEGAGGWNEIHPAWTVEVLE